MTQTVVVKFANDEWREHRMASDRGDVVLIGVGNDPSSKWCLLIQEMVRCVCLLVVGIVSGHG